VGNGLLKKEDQAGRLESRIKSRGTPSILCIDVIQVGLEGLDVRLGMAILLKVLRHGERGEVQWRETYLEPTTHTGLSSLLIHDSIFSEMRVGIDLGGASMGRSSRAMRRGHPGVSTSVGEGRSPDGSGIDVLYIMANRQRFSIPVPGGLTARLLHIHIL
jgi:hypothetical protein